MALPERPRIAVVGTGGIGGVVAEGLTRAGHAVTAVTGNAAIAEALNRDGYRVTDVDDRVHTTPVSAPARVEAGAQDGPFELCVVTTKATTLREALQKISPRLAPGAPVVVCQNGLPEGIAAEVMGPGRVVGAVVIFGASMLAPGVYERTSKGGFKLGHDGVPGPALQPVAQVLSAVSPAVVETNFAGARWSKLAINCATSTLGAIGGDRLGALLRRRFVRRLVLELWTEVVAVGHAQGVHFLPVAGAHFDKLTLSPAERRHTFGSPALAAKHAVIMAVGMKYRRQRSSMLIALERGRTPEIDYLNGEVVRRGRALGVPTPVNARLVAAVMDIVDGRETSSLLHLRRVHDELMRRT
jgi:2-dehydropantoate 2-reductase